MLIVSVILIASLGLSQVDASAIKGHARPHEEARSIKLAPTYNSDKLIAKEKVQAQPVPILESTKKIYNDESIRRLVAQQPQVVEQAPLALQKQAPASDVAPQVAAPAPAPVSVAAPAPVPVLLPVAVQPVPVKPVDSGLVQPVQAAPAVEPSSVVVKEAPVAPVAPVQVVEPKSAPVSKLADAKSSAVEPAVAKPDELPPQSDRSAPILASQEPVVVKEQVVPVKPVVQAQPVEQVASQAASLVEVAKDSVLQAKKEEVEPLAIEVPAPDPQLSLSDPIDSTTKLLIDLDEHVQKFLPAEEQQAQKEQSLAAGVDYSPANGASPVAPSGGAGEPSGKSAPLVPYSSSVADADPIVPPLPPLEGVEKASAGAAQVSSAAAAAQAAVAPSASRQGGHNQQNQQQVITQLLDQLDSLQNRIQDTINQLVARRRYVMSALLRPMGTYVRRVRTNLERLQNRVNQLQAAAVSVGGGQNRPGGFVDAAAIETIRRRIDDISKRISDIVNRIRFSLTPTSAPLNSNGRK